MAKADLTTKIIEEIQPRRLTQSQAASILGIDQPKVSALKQGHLSSFSIERLMRSLSCLAGTVEITGKQRRKPRVPARLRVPDCAGGTIGAAPERVHRSDHFLKRNVAVNMMRNLSTRRSFLARALPHCGRSRRAGPVGNHGAS